MSWNRYNLKLLPPSFEPLAPKGPLEKRIILLMSGGVDSSVTAHLLTEAGWEVVGITMQVPILCDKNRRGCCGVDAALVCGQLDIPHYFVDVTEAFEKLIIERFRSAYENAMTPNPCIDCNTLLKFALVWDFLRETFQIEYLATGHYAGITTDGAQRQLKRAADKAKDQSYFLYGILREKLPYLVLPLGGLTKQKVRQIAAELNLTVAEKPESMELCFAGEGDYRRALAAGHLDRPGDITDIQGEKIGMHKGIANYTIGQRRGIGFAGGKPLYVAGINAGTNTIALGTRDQLTSRRVRAEQINILIPQEFFVGNSVRAKLRSYSEPQPCTITSVTELEVAVEFDRPQFAPCPGQRLVLYDSSESVIAGGVITAGRAA
ncbi:MAG: tRNA 2-thiouridine(34) synthase MnmA [Planctomycetota bacterium]